MEENEVKPSFSLKYLLLIALTAAIIGGIGIGISKIFESRSRKELTVASGYLLKLINDTSLPKEQFDVEYYLKGNPRKVISSLFRKKVLIKNTGNEGVEDFKVTAVLKGDDIKLVATPKIETIPEEVMDTIEVKKDNGSTDKKHVWNVSLLNPGESITFEYSAYSEKKLDIISLKIIPRKKNWIVNYEDLTFSSKVNLTNEIAIIGGGGILLFLVMIFSVYPLYCYQWKRRPDYRKKYGTFWQFYFRHTPWALFSPEKQIANKYETGVKP